VEKAAHQEKGWIERERKKQLNGRRRSGPPKKQLKVVYARPVANCKEKPNVYRRQNWGMFCSELNWAVNGLIPGRTSQPKEPRARPSRRPQTPTDPPAEHCSLPVDNLPRSNKQHVKIINSHGILHWKVDVCPATCCQSNLNQLWIAWAAVAGGRLLACGVAGWQQSSFWWAVQPPP